MQSEGHWTDSYDYEVTSEHTALFSEYREVSAEYTEFDVNINTGALQKHNDPEGTPVLSEERYYWAMYAKARTEKIAARFLDEEKQYVIKHDLVDKLGSD